MNAWENVQWIAEEALMHMEDQLVIARLTARDKTSDFNVKPNGYAVGSTVDIKTRPDYQVRDFDADGGVIVKQGIRSSKRSMSIEHLFDTSVTITAKEKAMNMDNFSEEVLIPAAYRLAEQADIYVGSKLVNAAGLYASNTLFTTAADVAQARKAATLQQLDPASRWCLMDLDLEATLLGADWFTKHDARGSTGENIRNSAIIAQTMGMKFFSSINFPTNDTAPFTGGTVAATTNAPETITAGVLVAGGNNLIGSLVLPVDASTGAVAAGDRLQVAGMRRPLKVSGAFSGISGDIPLVDPITEPVPDNAAVTVIGNASAMTWRGLIFDEQSMAVAMPVLDPASDKPSAVASNNGISIRVVSGYDMTEKKEVLSMDYLIGAEAYDPRHMTLLGEY